jgi:SPP1 gp7 family putative phage head morphogenesis protein
MKYDLSNMIRNRRSGTSALMPIISESPGFERSYLAQARRIGQEVARGIREIIIPAYQRRIAQLSDALTVDADESATEALRLITAAMIRSVNNQIAQLLKLEGDRHTKAWMTSARKAFGVDLSSVVKEEDLTDFLEVVSVRNASLIKGMGDDLLKRVAQETTSALLAGDSVSNLQVRLKKQLEINDSRARLIARDQTSKLTSDLNRKRHQQAGVESYIWRTSQDERVRPRHSKLEGTKYRYGEPTGAEEGLPPGQPIQCRCNAQGVVEF